MTKSLEANPPERSAPITRSVAILFAGLYTGVVDAVVIKDSNIQCSTDALPPVLPHSLATLRSNQR